MGAAILPIKSDGAGAVMTAMENIKYIYDLYNIKYAPVSFSSPVPFRRRRMTKATRIIFFEMHMGDIDSLQVPVFSDGCRNCPLGVEQYLQRVHA